MATKLDEIEKRLWAIADDLRANSGLKASEYSEPVLGLIFLRFASERFKKATAETQVDAQQLGTIAGRLKNLASILSPPSLADKVIKNYPMPIDLAYKRFLEATSFFVYNVVLADTLQRLDPKQ